MRVPEGAQCRKTRKGEKYLWDMSSGQCDWKTVKKKGHWDALDWGEGLSGNSWILKKDGKGKRKTLSGATMNLQVRKKIG